MKAQCCCRHRNKGGGSNRLMSLVLVYTVVAIDFFGFSLVLPLLPFFSLEFEAPNYQLGILLAVYAAAQFISSLFMGRLSDRFGRRPMLLLSLAGSVVGNFLQAIAWDMPSLIIFRAMTGLLGGSPPIAEAYIADVTSKEERPKFLAMMGAVISLSFLFGPGIGAGLAEFDLSVPMFVASGAAAIGLVIALIFLPESHESVSSQLALQKKIDETTHADVLERLQSIDVSSKEGSQEEQAEEATDGSYYSYTSAFSSSSVASSGSVAARGGGKTKAKAKAKKKGPVARAGYSSISGVPSESIVMDLTGDAGAADAENRDGEHQASVAAIESEKINYTLVFLVVIPGFFSMIGFMSFSSLLALLLSSKFELGTLATGFAFSGLGVIALFVQVVVFNISRKKIGMSATLAVGSFVLAGSLVGQPLPDTIAGTLLVAVVVGAGAILTRPCISSLLSTYSPASQQGKALSFGATSDALARVVGPLLLSSIFEADENHYIAYFTAAGCSLVAGIVAIPLIFYTRSLDEKRKPPPTDPGTIDRGREPTKKEIYHLGKLAAEVMHENRYYLWYLHMNHVETVLRGAFPMVRDDEHHAEDIRRVIMKSKVLQEHWQTILG